MLASFDRRGRARDTFAQEEVHVLRGCITYHVSPRADPDEHRDCRRIDHLSSTSVACAGSTEPLSQDFLLPTARRMGYNSPRTTECDTWRVPNDWDEHDPSPKMFHRPMRKHPGIGAEPDSCLEMPATTMRERRIGLSSDYASHRTPRVFHKDFPERLPNRF